jgi:hypothetical protein
MPTVHGYEPTRERYKVAGGLPQKRGAGNTRTVLMSAQNGHLVCPGFAPCGFSHVATAYCRTFATWSRSAISLP